uniref:RHS repeat-associated core domain-containing protein n=1 Tax=Flavobacterium ajazii TaxID=2692318 RepID=UPI0013D1958E
NYYPFGMKHKGYNTVSTSTNPALKYKYNGKEFLDELGLNMYDYGARNYDPAIGRWMNIDPKAEVSRRWSPYSYCYDNPMRFVDPDGMLAQDIINPKFTDAPGTATGSTQAAYVNEVQKATGNTYKVDINLVTGNVQFTQVATGPVTAEQQAFIDVYSSAVYSPAVADVEIVNNDANVDVGSIKDNQIDIGDVQEFDKTGPGAASSAGTLAHETKEQQLKAEAGGVKGTYPAGALGMHRSAIRTAEDKVNGNRRVENYSTGDNIFFEPDRTKTSQTVTPTPAGGITVTKTKIP